MREHDCVGCVYGDSRSVVITVAFGASRKLSECSSGQLPSSRTGWGSQRHLRYTPKLPEAPRRHRAALAMPPQSTQVAEPAMKCRSQPNQSAMPAPVRALTGKIVAVALTSRTRAIYKSTSTSK